MAIQIIEIQKKKEIISKAELLKLLKQSKTGKQFNVPCIVTKEIADHILEFHNGTNRNINLTTVKQYTRNMANALWKGDLGDTITFDVTGNLMNGQHRLEGVSRSGIPMEIMLGFGYKTELKNAEGNGKVKSQADTLTMKYGKNVSYLKELATCVRFHYGFMQDQYHPHAKAGNENPSNLELALVEDVIGQSMMDSIHYVTTMGMPKGLLAISTAAYAHFLFKHTKHGEKYANSFMSSLASGENLSKGHPLLVVRNRFGVIKTVAITDPKTGLKDKIIPWSSQKAKELSIGLLQEAFNDTMDGTEWTSKKRNPESMIKLKGIKSIFGTPIYLDTPSQGCLTV